MRQGSPLGRSRAWAVAAVLVAGCSDAVQLPQAVLESGIDQKVRLDVLQALDFADAGGSAKAADATAVDAAQSAETAAGDGGMADASVVADASTGGSCQGACGQGDNGLRGCNCTSSCAKSGDCCSDWVPACYKGPPLDWYPAPEGQCKQAADWLQVLSNPDGDTIILKQLDDNGDNVRVRLLLIDTPELSSQDCYAEEAKAATYQALIRSKFKVCLLPQPGGDDKDVYGRLLRYVYLQEPGQTQPVQLNLRLLRQGMARVLYPYLNGNPLELVALATMATAKAEKLGGWAACGWVKPK